MKKLLLLLSLLTFNTQAAHESLAYDRCIGWVHFEVTVYKYLLAGYPKTQTFHALSEHVDNLGTLMKVEEVVDKVYADLNKDVDLDAIKKEGILRCHKNWESTHDI